MSNPVRPTCVLYIANRKYINNYTCKKLHLFIALDAQILIRFSQVDQEKCLSFETFFFLL